MNNTGTGKIIYEFRKNIQAIKLELDELGSSISDMPELINSANLLRSNEHLTKLSKKQSELICAYDQYSKALENMIDVVFDIQNDLKNLLREQSKLIPDRPMSKKRKSLIRKSKSKKSSKK